MEKLIVNGFRYTHTTEVTNVFGTKLQHAELLKHTWPTGAIEKLTTEQWNEELLQIADIIGLDKLNETEWDFIFYNGLITD